MGEVLNGRLLQNVFLRNKSSIRPSCLLRLQVNADTELWFSLFSSCLLASPLHLEGKVLLL